MSTADAQLVFKYKGDTSQAQKSVGKLGATLKKAGGIMAAAFAIKKIYAIGAAFEKSFAKVLTLVDRTSVSVDGLKKNIINLSNETGVAATELNEGLYQALSAGVTITNDGADALSFLTQNVRLAKAGFTDVNTAVDATTTVINAYGKAQSEVNEVSDILLATQNEGKTTVAELGSQLSSVIPLAASVGVEFGQVGASLAAMTAQGTKTTNATTQLRALFTELTNTTSKAGKAFEEINGKSFPEFVREGGNVSDGLVEMQKYADANNIEMISMFSNVRSASGALQLASDTGAAKFNKALNTMENSAGLTDAAFKEMTNTAEYKMEKAINKLTNTGIKLFGALAPVIELVAGALGLVASALAFVVDGFTGANRVATVLMSVLAGVAAAWLVLLGIQKAHIIVAWLQNTAMAALVNIELFFRGIQASLQAANIATGVSFTLMLGIIGVIIAAIAALIAVIAIFVTNPMAKEAKRIRKELKEMNDELEKTQDELESNMKVSDKLGKELLSLSKIEKKSTEEKAKMEMKVRLLNKSLGEEAVTVDKTTGELKLYGTEISNNGEELLKMIAMKKNDAEASALEINMAQAQQYESEALANKYRAEEEAGDAKTYAVQQANIAYREAKELTAAYDEQLQGLITTQLAEAEAVDDLALKMAEEQTQDEKRQGIREQMLADRELSLADHYNALKEMMASNYIALGLTEEEYIAKMAEHQTALYDARLASYEKIEDATQNHWETLIGINEDGLYGEKVTLEETRKSTEKNTQDFMDYYENLEILTDGHWGAMAKAFEDGGYAMGNQAQEAVENMGKLSETEWKIVKEEWQFNGGELTEATKTNLGETKAAAATALLGFEDTFGDAFGAAKLQSVAEAESMVDEVIPVLGALETAVIDTGAAIETEAKAAGEALVSGIVDSAKDGQSELVAAGQGTGNNYVFGVITALVNSRRHLISTAKSLAYSMNKAFNNALDIHSDSKVGKKSGEYYAGGVGSGVEAGTSDVVQKVVDMANAMANVGITGAASNQNVVYNNQRTVNATYQPEVPTGAQPDLQYLDFARSLKEGFAI